MTVRHLLQRGLVLAGVMSLVACQPGAAPTPAGRGGGTGGGQHRLRAGRAGSSLSPWHSP
ncbi:MAG: hypothetical protein KatS3mg061_0970 [Dehalococcoidia bacterium]|nr:MAG: hypothetical protein KatS3mg061_0970 [Dehalococcoidia bacterium]